MVTFLGESTRYHSARKQGHRVGRLQSHPRAGPHPRQPFDGGVGCLDPSPAPNHKEPASNHFSRRWRADTGLLNQGPVCLGVTCETPPPTHRQMTYTYRVGKKDLFLEAADSVASRSRDGSHPSAVSLAGLPLVGPKIQRMITKQPSSLPT